MVTEFQQKVWEYLKTIPKGEVRTYKQVAFAIGKPTAIRAVANACKANILPIIIPCHRVVRSDGKLGGYKFGGTKQKQKLLKAEDVSIFERS